jgi:hypothetical protein
MKRSQVYFNLHKRLFSVQQSGKVYAHADGVLLENARFNVAKAGQRKVRETGRKNVHARVSGYSFEEIASHRLVTLRQMVDSFYATGWKRAVYNPYLTDTFVDGSTGEPVHDARRVLMFIDLNGKPVILYLPTLSG